MNLLHRYLFTQVLFATLGAVGVFAFVLLVGNIVRDLLGALAAGQMTFATFFRLIAMLVPFVVSYALPMGLLTGVLLVLGRLSSQQEITAMRAAGLSLWRIATPIFFLAVCGLVVSTVFNCEYAPRARSGYRAELADTVRSNPLSFVVPRIFIRDFPGYAIYVGEKEGGALRDLWVWELDRENRVRSLLRAEEGTIDFDEERVALVLTLRRALAEVRPERDPEDFSEPRPLLSFEETAVALPLDRLLGRATFRRKLSYMTWSELMAERRAVLANAEGLPAAEVRRAQIAVQYAIQEKFVLAFAVVSFALVGVPLGIKLQRRESSANLGLALVLSMGFYFLLIMIDWLQKQPALRPDLLLWVPNAVFQALGLWLFHRVDRQ
jgi:lipopolysaccharide export system permease protein